MLENVKYPENSISYLNQGYLSIKKNKKMFYADYFVIGQIIEVLKPSENTDAYVCKEKEVKLVRPKYNIATGEFLRLYKTVGFIIVIGDENELFFIYGCDKEK